MNTVCSEEFDQFKRNICERHGLSRLKFGAVLDKFTGGHVCLIQATDSDNKTEEMLIKVITTSSSEYRLQFDHLAYRSGSSNLLHVRYVEPVEGRQYGYSLSEKCVTLENKRLTELEAWKVLNNVLQGLKVLHDNAFILTTITPKNILVRNGVYALVESVGPSTETSREFLAPEAMGNSYTSAVDIYSLGLTILTLLAGRKVPKRGETIVSVIEKLKCRKLMKDLLKVMLNSVPENRPTVDKLIEYVEDIQNVIDLMDAFEEMTKTAQLIQDESEEVSRLRKITTDGLKNLTNAFVANMHIYVALCYQYKSRGCATKKLARTIEQLVDRMLVDCLMLHDKLSEYIKSYDKPCKELEAIRLVLESRLKDKVVQASGTSVGVLLGSGITGTLVAVPSGMFGAAGAFIVAGTAFPPFLVILGGSAILAGIGLGIGTLVNTALNKGNQKLLDTVTKLLGAIGKITSLLNQVQAHMKNVKDQLNSVGSTPIAMYINEVTVEAVRNYVPSITNTVGELERVRIPEVPRYLLSVPEDWQPEDE